MKLRNETPSVYYVLILLLLSTAAVSQAQVKIPPVPEPPPSFVGKWKYEKAETAVPALTDAQNRGRKRKEEIEISQNDAQIRFHHTFAMDGNQKDELERVYYTDGRGEINPAKFDKNVEFVSTTILADRKIIIEWTSRKVGSSDKKPLTRDEWTLSKDGKSLRLEKIPLFKIPKESVGVVYVYKRQ